MKYETINNQLCRMVGPEPIFGSTKAPFVIVGKNTKHPTIITQDMDILLRIFLVAYSDEFEIIGYPVADGSAEWALYQMEQGKKVTFGSDDGRFYALSTLEDGSIGCYFGKITDNSCHENGEDFVAIHTHGGWRIHEPKPTYKVGDWVEFRDIEGIKHGMVEGIREEYSVLCNGISQSVGDKFIIRRLNPSEIVLDFGNGIKGRIRNVDDGWIRIRDNESLNNIATIDTAKLTEPIQTTVRKLLAAIEEERKKQ